MEAGLGERTAVVIGAVGFELEQRYLLTPCTVAALD